MSSAGTERTEAAADARPVEVRTRFERFPASIKGAFVLRGADGDPHSVRLESAAVVRIPSGPRKPVPLEDRMLDVAPSRDLFVPFEVGVSELEPSWYVIESSVRVDGGRSWRFAGRPFTVPWLRSDLRRGTIRVGRPVVVGSRRFLVDRLELGPDSASVVWRADPGRRRQEAAPARGGSREQAVEAVIVVDGGVLELLPPNVAEARSEFRVSPGELRSISYPLRRSAREVAVRLRVSAREQSDPLDVPLP